MTKRPVMNCAAALGPASEPCAAGPSVAPRDASRLPDKIDSHDRGIHVRIACSRWARVPTRDVPSSALLPLLPFLPRTIIRKSGTRH